MMSGREVMRVNDEPEASTVRSSIDKSAKNKIAVFSRTTELTMGTVNESF